MNVIFKLGIYIRETCKCLEYTCTCRFFSICLCSVFLFCDFYQAVLESFFCERNHQVISDYTWIHSCVLFPRCCEHLLNICCTSHLMPDLNRDYLERFDTNKYCILKVLITICRSICFYCTCSQIYT